MRPIAFIVLLLGFIGCNAPTAPSPPAAEETRRLVILPSSDQIAPNEILIPRVVVVTEAGDTLDAGPIEWSGSDPAVLRIIPDGRVVGVAPGTARVTARTQGGTAAEMTVTVAPLRFSQVVVGRNRTCALTTGGRAYCWGDGPQGLAIGITGWGGAFSYPERVTGQHLFTDIDMDQYRTCALDERGAIWCWGYFTPLLEARYRPFLLASGPFTALAVGGNHVSEGGMLCALTTEGRPWCDGAPVPQAPLLRSITAGARHACGLDGAGVTWCWGRGVEGQLGDGQLLDSDLPVRVSGDRIFKSVAAGDDYTCGVTAELLFCWGGFYNNTAVSIPTHIQSTISANPFTSVDMGGFGGGCALTDAGRASCWDVLVPSGIRRFAFPVFTTPIRTVSSYVSHACGIDQSARAWCWGSNQDGQLGDGSVISSSDPVLVRDHAELRY